MAEPVAEEPRPVAVRHPEAFSSRQKCSCGGSLVEDAIGSRSQFMAGIFAEDFSVFCL